LKIWPQSPKVSASKPFELKVPGNLKEGLDKAFGTQASVFLDMVTESGLNELPPGLLLAEEGEQERKNLKI